jgi:hypothetical protein
MMLEGNLAEVQIMNKMILGLLPLALPAMAGCANTLPPATQAAEVERIQCDSGQASDLQVMQSASVIKAEPLYSHVLTHGSNDAEERVDGAKLVIRPPEGVSPERMTRILQCHGARALLGKVDRASLPGDPFWLPDTWVSVEVKSENGNYAVTLEANDAPSNIKLAARAMAFAEAHPLRSSTSAVQ